ncbi:hypothetical protein L484_015502 [Morus notabilis]|uniref:Glycosyltransferase family 92 protein n=1 Tax=Morus notabilis TaxID=981085 RepID=W9S840_9ROSA|nr:hypothetical protein L484_015502 [Morus notabilis]
MAGLHSSIRPSSSSSLSSSSPSYLAFASRLLFLLTVLPLTLACFAFILQWRGGLNDDPVTRWSPDRHQFPGMDASESPSRTTSRSDCLDPLGRSRSPSFPYFRDWKFDYSADLRPKICITTSTSAGLEQTLPWIFYHKVIGVSNFFLFVEGKAASANVSKVLESIPGVKVIYRTRELEEQQAKSRIWNETWLASFFFKPCNYELFVKQSLNMEMAIAMAREAGMDWIFHLDTDELIHPAGTREYSLRQLLADVPGNVDMVIFPNYESSVERDDIMEPFSEVSMFKKNYDHLPKDVYFGNYKEATRGNPNYFLTYGNGKSAARVQDHLRPNGAHRWHNYMKTPHEIKLEEAAVLHYTYTKFSDLTSRRDRCGCKPTKEDVKRCFMLEFDRSAFIIASTATEEEMLRWPQPLPFASSSFFKAATCLPAPNILSATTEKSYEFSHALRNYNSLRYGERIVWADKELNLKLMRKGILARIYAPMVIIQGLRDSGVFSSVIAAAEQASLSKEKFLSSVESSNFSRTTTSDRAFSSRRVGKIDSKATTARRVLEFTDDSTHPSAIPPRSPPELEDSYIAI